MILSVFCHSFVLMCACNGKKQKVCTSHASVLLLIYGSPHACTHTYTCTEYTHSTHLHTHTCIHKYTHIETHIQLTHTHTTIDIATIIDNMHTHSATPMYTGKPPLNTPLKRNKRVHKGTLAGPRPSHSHQKDQPS